VYKIKKPTSATPVVMRAVFRPLIRYVTPKTIISINKANNTKRIVMV
jgi:hypothetical protein